MNDSFLIWVLVFLLILFAFVLTVPKYDPRFAGFRLSLKGLFLIFISLLFFELRILVKNEVASTLFSVIGYLLFAVGFVIMLIGSFKHTKSFFSKKIDAKRYVDPGYDLPFFDCPFCNGASVRLDALPCRCPACRKKIKKSVVRSG